jgi:hypothetical protein
MPDASDEARTKIRYNVEELALRIDRSLAQIADSLERLEVQVAEMSVIHRSNKELLAAINKNTAATNSILATAD